MYSSFVGFQSHVCSEALGESGLTRAHVARDDDALCHSVWMAKYEVEKLDKQAVFPFPMRESAWHVVYVELRLILEHAAMGHHES